MKLTPKQLKQLIREQIEAMAGAPDNIKEQVKSSGKPEAARDAWLEKQPESGGLLRARQHVADARREITERLAQEREATVRSAYRKVIATLGIAMAELEAAETEESYTLDT